MKSMNRQTLRPSHLSQDAFQSLRRRGTSTALINAGIIMGTLLTHSSPARAVGFDRENRPQNILGFQFVAQLQGLPLSGRLPDSALPYSDTYWPLNRGSIAYRWNSSDPRFHWTSPRRRADSYIFDVEPPRRGIARSLQPWQIAELSPAEKYDLYLGRYDYPLTRQVRSKSGRSYPYWRGICHGWSAAALNHTEPGSVVVTNVDGISIPFNSGDLKGLLNYYYAENSNPDQPVRRVGTRCRGGIFGGGDGCADMNAGAFHLVISNLLGIQHRGVIGELDPGDEIWNYPVFAYQSRVFEGVQLPAEPCTRSFWGSRTENCYVEGAARRVQVQTTVEFADDDENFGPSAEPVVGTANYRQRAMSYEYFLDLDFSDQIIGGEWISRSHPDFVWIKERLPFAGEYAPLAELLRASGSR